MIIMVKDITDYNLTTAWVLNNFGYSSPEKWVISCARNLLNKTNQKHPPINLKTLCRYSGIKVTHKKAATNYTGPEASLRLENNKFIIEIIYSRYSRARDYFSIAHEIAHTFFFNLATIPPKRIFTRHGAVAEEERLCNIAASEILMPEYMIKDRANNFTKPNDSDFTLGVFLNLLEVFNVSPPAMARRLCEDLSIWNSIMIGCNKYHSDNSIKDPFWRLSWCFAPKIIRNQLYIPQPSTHPKLKFEIIKEAYQKARPIGNYELISNFKLGNLVKIIREFFCNPEKLYIYATPVSVKSVTQLNFIEENDSNFIKLKGSEIIICIPLGPSSP